MNEKVDFMKFSGLSTMLPIYSDIPEVVSFMWPPGSLNCGGHACLTEQWRKGEEWIAVLSPL